MWRRVARIRTDFSEENIASVIMVTRIDELETTLAVTSGWSTLRSVSFWAPLRRSPCRYGYRRDPVLTVSKIWELSVGQPREQWRDVTAGSHYRFSFILAFPSGTGDKFSWHSITFPFVVVFVIAVCIVYVLAVVVSFFVVFCVLCSCMNVWLIHVMCVTCVFCPIVVLLPNSVALSPQANYTDWATATCRRNLVRTFVDRGASRG
jgi:hypothetical protein